jgi:hypothetical protein
MNHLALDNPGRFKASAGLGIKRSASSVIGQGNEVTDIDAVQTTVISPSSCAMRL